MKARNKITLVIFKMSGHIMSNSDLWWWFGGLHDSLRSGDKIQVLFPSGVWLFLINITS